MGRIKGRVNRVEKENREGPDSVSIPEEGKSENPVESDNLKVYRENERQEMSVFVGLERRGVCW